MNNKELITVSIFTFLENLEQFDFPAMKEPSCITRWYLGKSNKERYEISTKILDILKNNGIINKDKE